jgi:hypothetical protein
MYLPRFAPFGKAPPEVGDFLEDGFGSELIVAIYSKIIYKDPPLVLRGQQLTDETLPSAQNRECHYIACVQHTLGS